MRIVAVGWVLSNFDGGSQALLPIAPGTVRKAPAVIRPAVPEKCAAV